MTDMKCPLCGYEMICGGTMCHFNPDCPIHDYPVPTEVLDLLERTRKALDVAVKELKASDKYYQDDECIKKALDQIKQITETKE